MNLHNFTSGARANRIPQSLELSQLRALAPSAFATEAHESRSARYVYIPTVTVIEAMMREGFQPMKATQSRSRVEGKAEFTKHMIRFRHTGAMGAVVGDSFPEVVLVNSHDGTSAYKLMSGMFRLVCSNGLIRSEGETSAFSIQHTGNIVHKVIEGSFQIVKDARNTLEVVQDWQGLTLDAPERTAFAEVAHNLRFADAHGVKDTPIQPRQLLEPRRYEDRGADLWKTFNVVQENVIKGGLSAFTAPTREHRRGRMVTTREVKGIDQDVRLNRMLWDFTQRVAELKGRAVAA